ncbi:MAG: hypothetical protein CM15mP120_19930 [Pseudomonadota bacterium]|nr:MAG: hypothetical protein CM15mP120_19930 [Pseudomonadota bacterium]
MGNGKPVRAGANLTLRGQKFRFFPFALSLIRHALKNAMPRLKQVPRSEADPSVIPFYDALFGPDRDPVTEPGTATGTPGQLVDRICSGTGLLAAHGGGLSVLS